MKRTLPCIALLLAIGCPANRRATPTLRGSALPPPMRALAPAAIATITRLRGPESVLHDPQQDVYFISNINGAMLDLDGNGFISRVDASTLAIEPQWIAGGMNAPKGMAILGDALYVADINVLRKFDRRSGAPLGTIPITGDRPEKLAGGDELRHPNGLDVVDGKLRVVTFRGNELYELDGGLRRHVVKLPAGQLDGLTHLADGTALVSSWKGDEIYRLDGGKPAAILAGMDAPADLGYDAKRKRLLIPHPTANQVTIHTVY
jgi:hypothetical protein